MTGVQNELDEIWEHDVLGRRSDASYLQNYLSSRYEANPGEDGFVLAVNADWGYGKSFMLERWRQEAEFHGHPAIYFDAWKNDFTPDPLLAFISELEEGLTKHFKQIPIGAQQKQNALRILKKVLKPAATIIATTALKHITGRSLESIKIILTDDSDEDNESLGEDASKAAKEASAKIGEAIKSALEPHKTIKDSIKRFKENIALLIKYLSTVQGVRLPILFFVDELDRCRPNYAIELLEGIKHLFGVPGVTFVVATNLPQLSESIKAIYGSGFDGQRYLQRFFDLQFTLSRPDNASFSRLALERIKNSIPQGLSGMAYGLENEPNVHPSQGAAYDTIDYATVALAAYADSFNLSLRDIGQVTTMLEACFITLKSERVHIFFLVFLVAVYKLDPVIFKRLSSKRKIDYKLDIHPLIENGKHVEIMVNEVDEYGRRRGSKSITVPNIVDIYFSFLEQTDFSGLDQSTFPQRNFEPSEYIRNTGARTHTAPYSKYFAIVEQAGGFISRKKTQ